MVVQTFETTIVARETKYAITAITVPARAFQDYEILKNNDRLMGALGLQSLKPVLSPPVLPRALIALLLEENAEGAANRFDQMLLPPRGRGFEGVHEDCRIFAQQVAYAELIPFEGSLLRPHGLASIFASPSVLGIGALVGFVAAGGPTPLLLVTVPLGIVLVGAAKGIGEALETGLRGRILQAMGSHR
jgi:hypothetical protein